MSTQNDPRATDRAEAWDEGYLAGHECALPSEKAKTWGFHSCRIENPYRAAAHTDEETRTAMGRRRHLAEMTRQAFADGLYETSVEDYAEALRRARAETTTATTEDIQTLDARWFERWETEQPLADKYAGYYQGRVSAVAQCREELRRLLATAHTATTEDVRAEVDRLLLRHGHVEWTEHDARTVREVLDSAGLLAASTIEDAEEVLHGAGWFARADLDPRDLRGILHDLADAGLLRDGAR